MTKALVLVLCTGNSCRSQMAEAFLRAGAGDTVEVASAGTHPAGRVHPKVIEVMAERGLDLRRARSEHMNDYLEQDVSVVITVCADAEKLCPVFPGQVRHHHWPFKDPVRVVGTEEMLTKAFRRSRDELEAVFVAYGRGLADGCAVGGGRKSEV